MLRSTHLLYICGFAAFGSNAEEAPDPSAYFILTHQEWTSWSSSVDIEYDIAYDDLTEQCAGNPLPLKQCTWSHRNLRIFHFGDLSDGYLTGKFELTFQDPFTGATWECHDGLYTKHAEESKTNVQFTDIEIPEENELCGIRVSADWTS